MELAYVNIPMNRAKPGEIRTFEYNKNWSGNTERYFVDLSQYPRRLFRSDGAVAPIVIVKILLGTLVPIAKFKFIMNFFQRTK